MGLALAAKATPNGAQHHGSLAPMSAMNRRRHVRVRPLPELPAQVSFVGGSDVHPTVHDISIGGLGLATQGELKSAKSGDQLQLQLDLGTRYGSHAVTVVMRHGGGESVITGVEFVELPVEVSKPILRFVAELLERGAAV